MAKKRIGLIFGGKSPEHEVSLLSAASVSRAIDKDKYSVIYIGITKDGAWKRLNVPLSQTPEDLMENGTWENYAEDFDMGILKSSIDFALPIVHGPYCEDGKLQGFFETMDIPYGGCGVLASALAMDKLASKDVFAKVGFPICKHKPLFSWRYFSHPEKSEREVAEEIGYPCFVKPANMGSSVGITKVNGPEEFFKACDIAFTYDKRVIIEEALDVRDVEVAIIGNEAPFAGEVGEIAVSADFYDYDAKYINDKSEMLIPAPIDQETREALRSLAVKAYEAIDGEGFARIDFFLEKETGKILLNEINTIPGFTKRSMFPLLMGAVGISYPDVIERIIELGYERYNNKNHRYAGVRRL
ncbi:MAG: D-alanine--D-alanine ligase [Firmicutes bacterium]|nr:D-alanine--D-alanine ligase [Bacillota bacterium]